MTRRRVVRKRSVSRAEKGKAKTVFQFRSRRAKAQDLRKMAPIALSYEVWLHDPNRYDIKGVDTADPRLVFSSRSPRSQATDLAKRAKNKLPLEVWIRDTARGDLIKPKVDTPPTVRRMKVVKKEKEPKPKVKVKKAKRKRKGRKLPTKQEIIQRATENFMEEQTKKGLPTITPEEEELKESGAFEEARAELMRTKPDPYFERYVHDLNNELGQYGYTIVPVKG